MTYYAKASWPGRNDLKETDVSILWDLVVQEKLAPYVFYDGYINTYYDFKAWVLDANNYFSGIYEVNQLEPVGFFCLNGQIGKTAMIHFGLFNSGRINKEAIGKAVLTWCFQGQLKALYGLTPIVYSGVIRYIKNLGFQVIGKIPGACPFFKKGNIKYRGGVISVLTAEDFYKMNS